MKFEWQLPDANPQLQEAAQQLAQDLGMSPVMGQLLIQRGVNTSAEARRFFRPQLTELHNPFLYNDMDVAVERLNQALGRKERILIYGDYDVDGCTAVALVYKFLQQYYSNLDYYIPDRYEEGYGVSRRGINYAAMTGVKLIVVLDCGIKAVEEIAFAKEQGIDFIICDHHVPGDELPPAVAILNAKRADSTYPYPHLSGCGVGFKFMQAFAESNGIDFCSLIPLLDLVAVSIASDLVPIMGENRVLAYHGLKQLNSNPSTGMKAILEVCGLGEREVGVNEITFKIGPRINASGRVQNGREAVDLLVEKDFETARQLAAQIDEYNEQRKDLDKQMTEEANRIVATLDAKQESHSIVLFSTEWHKGIIGIVASRLTEVFFRPSAVITMVDGIATGSVRSVPGFDILKAIESCRDLLDNYGGHTYAAGLTLKAENVKEFAQRFNQYVEEHISEQQTKPFLQVEAQIGFSSISRRLMNDIKRLAPFGPANPRPLFYTPHVFDYGTSRVVGRQQEHIRLELVDGISDVVQNGIAFGQSSEARYIKSRHAFDIVYAVEENSHHRGEAQLQIEDIRPSENRE